MQDYHYDCTDGIFLESKLPLYFEGTMFWQHLSCLLPAVGCDGLILPQLLAFSFTRTVTATEAVQLRR